MGVGYSYFKSSHALIKFLLKPKDLKFLFLVFNSYCYERS